MNDARGIEIEVGDRVGTFLGETNKYWEECIVAALDLSDDNFTGGAFISERRDGGGWCRPSDWVIIPRAVRKDTNPPW
jgi:hypothetical protein